MKEKSESEQAASTQGKEHERAVKVARRQVKILTDLLREFAEGFPDLIDEIGGSIVRAIEPDVDNMSQADWDIMKRVVWRAYREWCMTCGRRLDEARA